jgi:Domain of unknown function (DUF4251)
MHMLRKIVAAGLSLVIAFTSCKSSSPATKEEQATKTKVLLDSKTYVFKAQTALPTGAPARQLKSDYDLRVAPDKVICYLPYMGTATAAAGYSDGNSLDFTSTDFEYTRTDRDKGGWDIVIKPRGVTEPRALQLTVYTNGSASLMAYGNNKSNMSFNGYITEDRSKK